MRQIKLSSYDFVGFQDGLISVNGNTYYNPKYYDVIGVNLTQREIIARASPRLSLKDELQQLKTIGLLQKKLTYYFRQIENLRYLKGDDALLKKRRLQKARATIKKYLDALKKDDCFNIETCERIISLSYKGKYVTARRSIDAR